MNRLFAELSAAAVAQLSPGGIAVLPVGADLVIAESVGRDAVATFGDAYDLWLLPAVTIASADELGPSLSKTPLHTLVLLNTSADHAAIEECARDLRWSYGVSTFILHPRPDVVMLDAVGEALLEVAGSSHRPLPS